MTIKALYPTVRPSLNLDFAKTKVLDPRITFTRASTGTFVGSNGLIQTAASGAPRFNHNPATGESLGLLVEEARTNLTLYSGDFSQAYWTKVSLSIFTANTIIAPDGTLTGSFIAFQNATSPLTSAQGLQASTGLAAGTNTLSCFAKIGTARYLALGLTNNGGEVSTAIFDLQTGTVNGSGSHPNFTVNGTSMVSAGAGWYRCSLTSTYAAGMATHISSSTSGLSGTYGASVSGDGTSGIYVWGAQIEASASSPTSYIPTTTATVTRAADVASMTGTNFSSWYRQDEGTLLVNARIGFDLSLVNAFFVSDATDNNHASFLTNTAGTNLTFTVVTANVTQAAISLGAPLSNTNARIAGGYQANNLAACINGSSAVIDSSGSIPVVSQLEIGQRLGARHWNSTISRLAYYPVRLPDAQLQALTAT